MEGVVYFLRAGYGPIKIGWCSTPEGVARRLKAAQHGHPSRLEIVATQPGPRTLEHRLHVRFRDHRLEGEWFAPAPDLLDHIARLGSPQWPPAADIRATPAEPPSAGPPYWAVVTSERAWTDGLIAGFVAALIVAGASRAAIVPVLVTVTLAAVLVQTRWPPRPPYKRHPPKTTTPASAAHVGGAARMVLWVVFSPLMLMGLLLRPFLGRRRYLLVRRRWWWL